MMLYNKHKIFAKINTVGNFKCLVFPSNSLKFSCKFGFPIAFGVPTTFTNVIVASESPPNSFLKFHNRLVLEAMIIL